MRRFLLCLASLALAAPAAGQVPPTSLAGSVWQCHADPPEEGEVPLTVRFLSEVEGVVDPIDPALLDDLPWTYAVPTPADDEDAGDGLTPFRYTRDAEGLVVSLPYEVTTEAEDGRLVTEERAYRLRAVWDGPRLRVLPAGPDDPGVVCTRAPGPSR